jgi:protein-tyrosine phosphatase
MGAMKVYHFDELELPNGGRLGLGCCPGHRLTAPPLSVQRVAGSLKEDLKLIAAWKPDVVLSLMEESELVSVGAPATMLTEELKTHGIAWHHLPICDLGAPDERFETVWIDLWPQLDALFQNKGRAFIHCYAGLGRTGTVAALILMQYGQRARDALRLVRTVRPGSIQSIEQDHYLSVVEKIKRRRL